MYIKPKESYVFDQELFEVGSLITYAFVYENEVESEPFNGLISGVNEGELKVLDAEGGTRPISVNQLTEFPIEAEKLQPTIKILGIIPNAISGE